MKTAWLLVCLCALGLMAQTNDQLTERYYTNDATTGTAQDGLVSLGTQGRVVQTVGGATDGAVGICKNGCGIDGRAQIVVAGIAKCRFDSATTVGHWVQISATMNNCHDTGSSTVPGSGQIIGLVLSTNASGGIYDVQLQIRGGGASGGGSAGPGSAPAVTLTVTAGATTQSITCTANTNIATITVQTTITLVTPPTCPPASSPAAGPWYIKIINSGPLTTQPQLIWAGVTQVGCFTAINSTTNNDITWATLNWTGSQYECTLASSPTQTPLGLGVVGVLGPNGVGVAATATNMLNPWTGTKDAAHCAAGDGTMQACGGGSSAYSAFQQTLTGVTMTGADVAIYTFSNVPALAAGSCYAIEYGTGTGLNGATIKVKVGSTVISTPFVTFPSGFNVFTSKIYYCNNPGSQTAQTVQYDRACAVGYSNSGIFPITCNGVTTGTDVFINTPTGVNWATTNTITITINQGSGTVIPLFAHINGPA